LEQFGSIFEVLLKILLRSFFLEANGLFAQVGNEISSFRIEEFRPVGNKIPF